MPHEAAWAPGMVQTFWERDKPRAAVKLRIVQPKDQSL